MSQIDWQVTSYNSPTSKCIHTWPVTSVRKEKTACNKSRDEIMTWQVTIMDWSDDFAFNQHHITGRCSFFQNGKIQKMHLWVQGWRAFVFSCMSILLSRESDYSALRARSGVASQLSTTLRWGNPVSAFPNGTASKLAGLFSTLSL